MGKKRNGSGTSHEDQDHKEVFPVNRWLSVGKKYPGSKFEGSSKGPKTFGEPFPTPRRWWEQKKDR